MCLPVGLLKTMITFSTVLVIIIGGVGIGFGIFNLVDNNELFEHWGNTNWQNVGGGILLGFGIIVFLFGIIGTIGAVKKSRCALCIYNFGNLPFALVFFIIAIAFNVIVEDKVG